MDDAAAIRLLTGAVSIPSPSGAEADVAHWLHSRLEPDVDRSSIDEAGNYLATVGTGPVRLYCLGHIDTVPGDIPVRIEDGWLWGRGSVDAKGSFCSHAAGAIRAFRDNPGLRDHLSVTLIGAAGEEAPHSIGARHAVNSLPAPDLLLIGEPSGWQSLTLGYKGQLTLKLTVTSPEAHSAGKEASAADCLMAICAALREQATELTPPVPTGSGTEHFRRVQMTVTALHSSSDGLRQHADATISFRLPPGVTASSADTALRGAADHAARTEGRVELHIESSAGVDAVLGEKDSILSRCFRAAIRQQGGRPGFKVKTGTSDMNVVAPYWQAPVLAYGPGDSALDHTPDERVLVSEYLKAVAVTADAIQLIGELTAVRTPADDWTA